MKIKDPSLHFKPPLLLYKVDKEKDDYKIDYMPEYFDTEYLLQEPSKELSFEMFTNELKPNSINFNKRLKALFYWINVLNLK